jgi:hypothetical protein
MAIDTTSVALQAGSTPALRSRHRQQASSVPPLRVTAQRLRAAILALAAAIAAAAWMVAQHPLYTPGSNLGYALGVAGGSVMLMLLLYPIRKHTRFMQEWGRLKYWFLAHMLGGILGPLLVLFHSTFRVGSFNAGVALSCMLLVVASGLVGRFLYRRVHHGLYGSRATLREAQQALHGDLAAVEPALHAMPRLRQEVERFIALAAAEPSGWRGRAAHFLTLGWKRALAWRHVHHLARQSAVSQDRLASLLQTIDLTFRAAQQAAQFSTYERLFALWHVVHIPFLCMLVITAVIHVVAVHAY